MSLGSLTSVTSRASGAPHLGAPLEKAVNLLTGVLKNLDAAGAQVPAELLDSRSAGVKDLRYGYTIDEEWAEKDPDEVFADARRNVPLVDGVGYYFLAATISRDPGASAWRATRRLDGSATKRVR